MKRMTIIFTGIFMLSISCLFAQKKGQIIIDEDFEAESKTYGNSFYEGSIQGWNSTHGTPDTYSNYIRISPFKGSRYVHLYIEKAGDCSKSPDRGEGIALNYHFEGGYTYKLKYAVRGQVNEAQWVLCKNSLPSISSRPKYCEGGEIVPGVQSDDIIIESNEGIDLENWKVSTVEFSIPHNSSYAQLWFRASNMKVPEKEVRTHLYLDAISIVKICNEIDCNDLSQSMDNPDENNTSQKSELALLDPIVYPNPSTNIITMQLRANGKLTVETIVFDSKGSIVKSFEKENVPGGLYYKTWKAWKEVGNGIFFIHFKTNYGTFQRKVVIQDKL